MPNADLKLDGVNAIVEGNYLLVKCLDIQLNADSRRSTATGARRALVHGFHDELVVNYGDDYPGGVTIRGEVTFTGKIKQNHVYMESTDLHIDHPARRSSATGSRRTIVHGFNDEIVLNYNKDYPGGTTVHGTLDVKKGGHLRVLNSSGNVTAYVDQGGNLRLGGNNTDGDLILKDSSGNNIIDIDAQYNRLQFKDTSGTAKVRLDSDQFISSPWPTLPGESTLSRLDLITEMRKMKEEIIALRQEVDALTS